MDELADSSVLVHDQEGLRRRLAADGYLCFRGLLPADQIRAAGAAVSERLRSGGWVDDQGRPSALPRAVNPMDALTDLAFRAAVTSAAFNRIPYLPPLRSVVRRILGPEAFSYPGYELSKRLSLSMRDREIIIDRTCARCGCEYEWGLHVAFFAGRVGLSPGQITSLTHGSASDPCWTEERDRLLIEAADALHESSDIGDGLWTRLAATFPEEQLLDLMMLCGWYHAISFTANGARVAREEDTPRFTDVVNVPSG